MKKLYIIALIAGLSFGQTVFGMDFFKNLTKKPHEKLKEKIRVTEEEIAQDVTFLLSNGYEKITSSKNTSPFRKGLYDWKCYIKSPEGKCVINKDYAHNLFTTHYK